METPADGVCHEVAVLVRQPTAGSTGPKNPRGAGHAAGTGAQKLAHERDSVGNLFPGEIFGLDS